MPKRHGSWFRNYRIKVERVLIVTMAPSLYFKTKDYSLISFLYFTR